MTHITRLDGAFVGLFMIAVLVIAAKPATAQGSRQNDISSGYLNVSGSMNGMNIQLSSGRTRRLSLVGQIDWSRGPDPDSRQPIYHDVAGLAGIRFGWQPTRRISPFWQVSE